MSVADLVFVHPSDELYGADRMLLELLAAVGDGRSTEVWLPTDLPHGAHPLCELLTARGVAVRHLDLPIMRRAYRTPRGLSALVAKEALLVRELLRARPRTVYCTTSAAFLAAPAARLARVGQVIGHVQEIWSPADQRVLAPAAATTHTLIAISESAAGSLPARLQARTTVVPNATPDPGPGHPLAGRSGPLQYVIASRWNGWKGHRTLLSAWDTLTDPGHLVVLGGPPGSGESVDVVELVARLRHPESVTVVGDVADPAPYLEAADVALIPSDDPEPFGLVAIEAFARGRPVIGSAGGGLLDIVTHGQDGWLFTPGDAKELAALLAGLDRESVTTAGQLAQKSYQSRFTTEVFRANWNAAAQLGPVSDER